MRERELISNEINQWVRQCKFQGLDYMIINQGGYVLICLTSRPPLQPDRGRGPLDLIGKDRSGSQENPLFNEIVLRKCVYMGERIDFQRNKL